jgi:serine protease AprX
VPRLFSWSRLALVVAALFGFVSPAFAAPGDHPKLDGVLNKRAKEVLGGHSRVIVVFNSEWNSAEAKRFGGKLGRRLNLIGAQVLELPNGQLKKLADHPAISSIHHDRPFTGTMSRVTLATGASSVQRLLGYTGAGVGVAVIDSGVTSWHDDLQYNGTSSAVRTNGGQRVAAFVDFVNGQPTPYDDYGHGTHVSGIIAGNGYDSSGIRAGMAPDAHLVSLRVLDGNGRGVISNVIAALDYIVANKNVHNIRVANLSVGAAVTESFNTDPLTIAAKRAVEAGIVVVTAAGNLGRDSRGVSRYGGITAPANAPWVLTVGASNHQGTPTRVDDVVAEYSSRGPTPIDLAAKPDLVAHGTGIVSLSDPNSLFYSTKASYLLKGSRDPGYKPYLGLTGTSMAAPVVTGTVALMIQANPNLTPNLVKAILQYTAEESPNYNALTQGAGFLNARGAVDLAKYFGSAQAGAQYPYSRMWSRRIIWGDYRLGGGAISSNANAFEARTVWGAQRDEDGDNIVWGTLCESETCANVVGNSLLGAAFGVIDEDLDNIVWGTSLNGSFAGIGGNVFNIVWGTSLERSLATLGEDLDNIVWGTNFGSEDGDNIVWGTSDGNSDVVLFDDPDAPPGEVEVLSFDVLFAPVVESSTTGMGGLL